jgi:diguanylate cyclase (GGDEF)-like protein/PAS domain S-box-containing protein
MSSLTLFRRSRLAVAVLWAYPVFVTAWLLGGWGGERVTGLFASYSQLPSQLVSIGVLAEMLANGRLSGYRRRAWYFLLAASIADFLAGLAWAYQALAENSFYGTWADALYMLYYPLLAAGYLLLFMDRGGSFRRRRIWLDVATFGLGLGTALWVLIYGPAAHAPGRTDASVITTFGYSAGNTLTMVTAALLFMQVMNWKSERSTMLLIGVAAATLFTDVWWVIEENHGTYALGTLVDVGYSVTSALIATAATLEYIRMPVADNEAGSEGNVYSFLPVFAVLLAILLLFGEQVGTRGTESTALLIVVAIGAALVVARQMSVRHDVLRLNRALATRQTEARLTELVRRSSDLIAVIDVHGQLSYVSPAAERVLGVPADRLQHTPALEMMGPDNAERLQAFLDDLQGESTGPADLEVELTTPAGEQRSLQISGSDHRMSSAIAGLTLTVRDVTEHKRLEEQLRALAFYDPLTLLANRSLFSDRVRHAVDRIADGQTPAVLFIDLDNFKTINDGLGHSAGDKLLCACAQRIVQGTRAADTVARLGGDEFAVLLDNASSPEAALSVANHILRALTAPLDIEGRELHVGASIGICIAGPQTTTEHLLRNADAAMYRAKALGKGQAVLFEAEMAKAARRRLLIEQELAAALDRGELFVHYQPIVDLKSAHLIGVEALMRWRHPTRGVVMPGEFIPIAEETGHIVPMTQWILRQACFDAASLRRAVHHGEGLRLSVNISGRCLQHKSIVEDVACALRDSRLDPDSLVLEVTESLLLQESPDLERRLNELKSLGVRLALDDFGTGYSSLAYLHRFPLDVLKIDRSFIQQLSGEVDEKVNDANALARAILSLAEALGLDTVAEGIEIESQREALLRLGCQTGQGYTFGRPMPLGELLNCHAARRREVLAENLTGPVEFTATGRFRRPTP